MPKAGSTRYQKFRKSEKAKTKLKGKKELPKGTNVTKTNFKVKQIVIKEQLKKHGQTEALSSRKLNIKELLSRLSHFNTNARMDALSGLKEVLSLRQESLEVDLGQIINGVAPLILNIEKKVRRESIKALQLALSNVSPDKIDPFFAVLSTYLRSAMTHIDTRIQEDSLLFFDVLLLGTPQLLALDFHKIIPNFLDMISKLKIDANHGRTLTVNLNSQITSVKWRAKVFHRLQQFLDKFAECNNIYKEKQLADITTHFFSATRKNNFPLYNPIYTSVCTVSCFSSKNSQTTLISDEVIKFKSYVETLMPLLFEIWLEACPKVKGDKNIETVINEDTAILLKHTLGVISLIWKLVEHFDKKYPSSMIQESFSQNYKAFFNQHFVASFPYVTNLRPRMSKYSDIRPEDVVTDPKLIFENLDICYLYISINLNLNMNDNQSEIMSVFNYIGNNLYTNSEDVMNEVLLKILHKLFSEKVTAKWTTTFVLAEPLFEKIVGAYFNENIPKSFKRQLFQLLCKISFNDNLIIYHSSNSYNSWLKVLPDVLLEDSIDIDTINNLLKFAIRKNMLFNLFLKPKLADIIQNLPKITVSGCADKNHYYKLYSILYQVHTWNTETIDLLEQQIMNDEYDSDYGIYIMEMLKCRNGICKFS